MLQSKYPFRNLIFEGGGVKGIAYSGARCAGTARHPAAHQAGRRCRGRGHQRLTARARLLARGDSRHLGQSRLPQFHGRRLGCAARCQALGPRLRLVQRRLLLAMDGPSCRGKNRQPRRHLCRLGQAARQAKAVPRRHQLGHATQSSLLERPLARPAGGRRCATLDVHPAVLRRRARVGRFICRWRRAGQLPDPAVRP